MAESNDASAPEGAPLSVLDASSLSGQSKSSSESFQEFDEIDLSNKDKYFLICIHCKCKVMRASVGTLIQKESFMPSMTEKYNIGMDPNGEALTDFWCVSDMYHFENVGFSKNVGSSTLKYLLCADCEIGPIGWHDTVTKDEFYVAAKRVKYSVD